MPARTLSCLLAVGLALPVLAAAATPATADTLVSGIVVDTGFGDGLGMNEPTSLHSPTYETTATAVGSVTTFQTRYVSNGQFIGPQVSVAPPTSAATLAPGHYTTAKSATETLAGLLVESSTRCSAAEGTLDVTEVAYTNGLISSLAASWSYRCAGTTAWAFGEVRHASTSGVTSGRETRFLHLGPTGIGTTTPAKASVLGNNGTLPLTFGTAHFTGTHPGDFAIAGDGCSGQTLAVGATCEVSVTSSPTVRGERSAVLEIPDGTARGFRRTAVYSTGTTAPAAPQAVAATTATDGVGVTWASPADDGGSTVTGFQVYRGTTADDLTLLGTTRGLRYGDPLSDTTSASTPYVYAVKAVNAIGASPLSLTATATTPASAAVPSSTALLSLDLASGYAPALADASVLRRDAANGDSVSAGESIDRNLGLTGARVGSSTLDATLTPPTGTMVQAGSFPLASVADATHGRLTVWGMGGYSYCLPGTGTADVARIERTAAGAIAFLDADLSFACGGGTTLHHLAVRVGTSTPFAEVQVPDVAAGPVAVSTTKTVQSTYTNSGTTAVTVTGVVLSAPAGGAAVDWSLPAGGATCAGAVLAPGGSCSTDVQVAPTAGGSRPGLITYTDSTPAGTHVRRLSAEGAITPAAPDGFSVSRRGGKVSLSWSSWSDVGQAPTSWTVLVGPDADHLSPLASVTSPTVTDPSTADGYRLYRVSGTNAAGTGPSTDVPVDARLQVPTAAGITTVKTLRLSWSPAGGLPADPITSYRVYRGTTAATLAPVGDVSATQYSTAAPAPGVHAYFAVAPLVGATVGPRSNVVDLVGTSTQLVVATVKNSSSTIDIRGTNGGTTSSLPESGPDYAHARIEVAVNPKGTQVAYVQLSLTNGVFDVWVRNVDGSRAPVRLTSPGKPKSGLSWSPDGTKVAFSEFDGTSTSLKVVTVTGTSLVTVPKSTDLSNPSWLDAATLVAEDDSSWTAPLVKVVVATGARTPLARTAGGTSPSVRPDSTEVAFLLPNGPDDYELLRVLNLKTGSVRAVPAPADSYLSRPSWTRDGSRLFLSAEGDVVSVASNGAGAFSVVYSGDVLSVAVSTPDTTAPTGVKLAGVPATTLATTVTPTFSATDAMNGVATYTLLTRKAAYNGSFGASTATVLTAARAVAVAKGYTYCFSVRATDRAGNVSAATAEQCTSVPMDDRMLARSSTFTPVTSSAYYASTGMRTTTRGATLTRGVTATKQLYLVVTTCPSCGTLDVLVGSARIGAVNLASRTTVNKKVIALPPFSTRNGTVTLRVTSRSKMVLVDGLGVRK
jgi:hypothetical protein